jgi:uncharacterized protein YciI
MKLLAAAVAACLLAACASHAQPSCPAPGAGTLTMRSYFLVLLRRGPAWTPEKTPETQRIFEGHMANIQAMGASGALVIAGPTDAPADDPRALAGIFVLGVASQREVEELIANDPAIQVGRLVPEILPWYGPAGLTYPGQRAVLAAGE